MQDLNNSIPFLTVEYVNNNLLVMPHYEFFHLYNEEETLCIINRTIPLLKIKMIDALKKHEIIMKKTNQGPTIKIYSNCQEDGIINIEKVFLNNPTHQEWEQIAQLLNPEDNNIKISV